MDYRRMLEGQPQDKTIIIEDGQDITYYQLLRLAKEMEEEIQQAAAVPRGLFYKESIEEHSMQPEKHLYFIQEDTITKELAVFIACQGSNLVPIILAENISDSEKAELRCMKVPEEAVMGVMTSGTTGQHKILFRTYESWADYFPYQNQVFSMDGNTVLFAQGSLAFTGNMNLYMALFSVGGTVVATKKFEPRYWFSLIKEYQANYIYLIPTKMMALCKTVKEPYTGVKHFVTGSQSFGKKELQKAEKSFPEISVVLYYGSSEANYITYLTDKEMTEDSRLVGRPFPGVRVSIQNGVFYVDSQYGIIGIEHPFCTQDLGSVDEEGRFYFGGRQDDLLNVNGKKYSAYRIERVIWETLGVANLVAVRKEENKDILITYYESEKPFSSVLQVRKQLQGLLAEQEIPRQFIPIEKLPRTNSGKIRRNSMLQ